MSILLAVVLFACVIGVVLALITLSLQRISGRILDQYKDRLDEANTILNGGLPPEAWVAPFRKRIEAAAAGPQGGVQAADGPLEQIGERARRQFLKRLKSLIKFMEKGNFYDEDRTRKVVLEQLTSVQRRWTSCHWSELVLNDGANAEEN